jgi:hypothetical protein
MTYARNEITPEVDGYPYAVGVALPPAEQDIGAAPLTVPFHRGVTVTIDLVCQGSIPSNQTYLVVQTDNGSGQWVDLGAVVFTGTSGRQTYLLAVGFDQNGLVTQTRQTGQVPTAGVNAVAMGARIRVMAKCSIGSASSSSSPSAGQQQLPPAVLATVYVALKGLR